MINTCHVCHEKFDTHGANNRRTVCFDPPCIAQHKENQRLKKIECMRRTALKSQKDKRTYKRRDPIDKREWDYHCNGCGKKLKYPYRFNCPHCLNRWDDRAIIFNPSEVYGGLAY